MIKREIILDTETTGLRPENGHKLIEICGMEVINGVKTGEVFHHYVNPLRDVPMEAYRIHGIATEFLLDKKTFPQISEIFINFIEGAKLVIHNAKFDVGFLNYELKSLGLPAIKFENVIDTLDIARKKYPGSPASLDALCKRFKVNLDKRDKHGALIDVELLYEVYRYLCEDHLLIKTETKKDLEIISNINVTNKTYRESRNYSCTEEELSAHEEFLKKIKEPIWHN